MILYKSNSSKQTKKFAADLAGRILRAKTKRKNALVFALLGDLGSGKTTFVQGFLRSLGIRKKITSPTFVLMKKFQIPLSRKANPRRIYSKSQTNPKSQNFKNAYHLDCYRIQTTKDFSVLGLKEILANPRNIVLIEWPEKIRRILPKNTIWLKFEHAEKENQRMIKFNFSHFSSDRKNND